MSKVTIDYSKVSSVTQATSKSATDQLKSYSQKEYKKLTDAMQNCKGDYKTAIVQELQAEQKALEEAANFMIRLQNMIKKTADSYQEVDSSYTSGAAMK